MAVNDNNQTFTPLAYNYWQYPDMNAIKKFAIEQAVKLMTSGNSWDSVIGMATRIEDYLNGK